MKFDISGDNFDPNQITKDIKNQILHQPFDTKCPNCHRKFKVQLGHNKCPYCGASVNVAKGKGWG